MFYDSMICKLIVYGADRPEAIRRMREALNGFLIRGISSNIAFQSALLAHPRFQSGQFNTGFIAEHYPKGFSVASAPHEDPQFLRLIAAAAHGVGALPTGSPLIDLVVVTRDEDGQRHPTAVGLRRTQEAVFVTLAGQEHRVSFADPLRDVVVRGDLDGREFCVQIERAGLDLLIGHGGTQIRARVLRPRLAELNALMPYKPPPDLSKFLLAPMPGLLVEVAVQPGQQVRAGERLAAIEAMKMENILVATQDCVVAEVAAKKGDSLAVDQVIVRFE